MSDEKLPDGWFMKANGLGPNADMMARGSQCHRCPLRGSTPALAECHYSSILVVGDHPRDDDVKEGRPFVGPDGMELSGALRVLGKSRTDFDLDLTASCQPPKNEMDRVHRWVARERKRIQTLNKTRAKGDHLLEPLTPEQACYPRLRATIERRNYRGILALGAAATKTVLQTTASIMELRGTLQSIATTPTQVIKVLPAFHPGHVQRFKRWRPVFQADVGKALRYFDDKLKWVEPLTYHQPSPAQFRDFLYRNDISTTVDIETTALEWDKDKNKPLFDPLTDILRCVSFSPSSGEFSVIVPFLSVDGSTQFYTTETLSQIWDIFIEWMEDEKYKKIGHNWNYYDFTVLDSTVRRLRGLPLNMRNVFDTLMGHHVIASEQPHGLGFVASIHTDAPAWKSSHTAVNATSDRELWQYAGRDTAINSRVAHAIISNVEKMEANKRLHPGYRTLMEIEHGMQDVCRGLHRVGMPIDQTTRGGHESRLTLLAEHWKKEAFEKLGVLGFDPERYFPEKIQEQLARIERKQKRAAKKGEDVEEEDWNDGEFNLGSRDMIGDLLFDRWNLPFANDVQMKELFTKSGDRSTGDAILRSYVGDTRLSKGQREFVHSLRMYRRQLKVLGTNVIPLRREFGTSRCKLSRDGRVHADWKAHGTLVGRLAADNPNVVNWTADIRDMVRARPGYILIDADQDALHLRIIASLWKIPSLQEAFLGKPRFHRGVRMGPHEVFAELLYGDDFMKSPHGTWPSENPKAKWMGRAKNLRDCAKTVRYAGAYGARVPTIFREVTSAEDKKTGELTFAHMKMEHVEAMHQTWMEKEPQWETAWARETDTWKRQGYLADPIHGRRRYFGDQKETDVINYRVLGTEAALMNEITLDLIQAIPFESIGEFTGLIQQNYDSVLLEIPAELAEHYSGMVKECMERHLPGLEVGFVGNPALRECWE